MPAAPEEPARGGWFVAGVVALVFLATVLPDIVGHLRATPERLFIGTFTPADDNNVYYGFASQVRDGAWLFENRWTTAPHPARLLNLQWLAVGLALRGTGWSTETIHQLWHLAGVALLIAAFWRITGHITTANGPRRLVLAAFATGGGFGWAFLLLRQAGVEFPWDHIQWPVRFRSVPYDLSVGTPFRVMMSGFHALSFGLFVYGLERYIAGERHGGRGAYVASAAATLVLAFSHPYEAMTLAATVAFVIALRARSGTSAPQPLVIRAMPALVTVAGALYTVLLFARYPVYRWASTAPFPPHLPLHQVSALGLFAVAALWGVRAFFARAAAGEPAYRVIAAALVANLGIYYSFPLLWFSGNFRTTLIAPVMLVALVPIVRWWPRLSATGGGIALLVLLLVANGASSAVGLARKVAEFGNPMGPHYVDAGLVQLGRWLDANRSVGDAVLAPGALGHWLPAHAGVHVYAGDVAPTASFARRAEEARAFFTDETSDDERGRFLRAHRTRWVVATPEETPFAPDPRLLARRFESGGYRVYEVVP
jgi:hypothetical protein